MQFSRIFFVAALAGLMAQAALADDSAPQAGLAVSAEFEVTNTGIGVLECAASIAHWFSEDIGEIAPGARLNFSFGYELDSGTFFRLNAPGERMAVQRLWCGEAGRSWESRAEILLARHAGLAPATVRLDCATEAGKTSCEAR